MMTKIRHAKQQRSRATLLRERETIILPWAGSEASLPGLHPPSARESLQKHNFITCLSLIHYQSEEEPIHLERVGIG